MPWLRDEVETLLSSADDDNSQWETPLLPLLLNADSAPLPISQTPPDEFRPTRLGKYLLLKKLGEGGMAEVYLAKTTGPGGFQKYLALKRVIAGWGDDLKFRKLFENEARLCSILSHPNVVHIYDFAVEEGNYLLAMEYVSGKNLGETLRKIRSLGERFPAELALFIVGEICSGLEYAHTVRDPQTGEPLRIVHRDISPKNIMISYEGAVKILDFGIAKARNRESITQTGSVVGTVQYMAPERLDGGEADPRSDLFSASAIFYELLADEPLFPPVPLVAAIHQLQNCTLPETKIAAMDASEWIKSILKKGLEKKIEKRYQSAGSLLLDLQSSSFSNETPIQRREKLARYMCALFDDEIRSEKEARQRLEAWANLQAIRPRSHRDPPAARSLHPPSLPPGRSLANGPSWMSTRTWLAVFITVALLSIPLAIWLQTAWRPLAALPPSSPAAGTSNPAGLPAVARGPQPAPAAVPKAQPSLPAVCSTLFETVPAGAKVWVDGIALGKTPFHAELRCGASFDLKLEYRGYRSFHRRIIVRGENSRISMDLSKRSPPPGAP